MYKIVIKKTFENQNKKTFTHPVIRCEREVGRIRKVVQRRDYLSI